MTKRAEISPSIPTQDLGGVDYVRLAKGELKPLAGIKPQDVEEDELVRRLSIEAEELSARLVDFRRRAFAEMEALRDLLFEKYNVKRGGRRGGLVFTTVDTSLRVRIDVSDTIALGPELEIAKELIDGCIRRWMDGGNMNIRVLVDDAFKVDKTGKINVQRILSLRNNNIVDETGDWQKAMDIISDAVRVMSSKEYVRFHRIDRDTGAETRIPLDIAGA